MSDKLIAHPSSYRTIMWDAMSAARNAAFAADDALQELSMVHDLLVAAAQRVVEDMIYLAKTVKPS